MCLCILQVSVYVSATGVENNADKFLHNLKFIMNIDGQVVKDSTLPTSLDAMASVGLTGFRHFIRKTPTTNIGGYGSGSGPPTDAELQQPFPLAHHAISKGLKVVLGCGDVTNPDDVTGGNLTKYISQVTRCAQLIKAENFTAGYLAVEWANELAGSTNDFWNPVNTQMAKLVRSILPDTPIIHKGCNWGYFSNNIDGSLAPPVDSNVIFGHHSYTMVSQGDAITQAQQIHAFWTTHGYAGALFEEAGFNNGNDGQFNQNEWEGNYQIWTNAYSALNEPMGMWVITYGEAFRANDEGTLMPRQTVQNIISWFSGGGGKWHYNVTLPQIW